MGLESTTYIDGLVATNPPGSDNKSTADDHLRLIKAAIKATFPNIDAAVTVTEDDLNKTDTHTQTELNRLGALGQVIADGGAVNAPTATTGFSLTGYTDVLVVVKIAYTNTSTVTLDVDSVGAIAVKRQNNDALEAGDLTAGGTYLFGFEGTYWHLMGSVSYAVSSESDLRVRVSSNDTTNGYLNGKAVAGECITLTENSDGGDETLSFSTAPTMTAKTADYTITAAELLGGLTTFVNTGASGEVNFTLPAGASNYSVSFLVTAAQYLKVTADGTEVFNYGGTDGAAGGYIRKDDIGTAWTLKWNGAKWAITNIDGTLKHDE